MFASHPDTWVVGGSNHAVDLVLSIHGQHQDQLDTLQAALQRSWSDCALEQVFTRDAVALPDKKVHFNYRDSLSQPALAIEDLPAHVAHAASATSPQPAASAGSFLLGAQYKNVYGGDGSLGGLPARWATNATFAVLRVMRQDVAGFEHMLDAVAQQYRHIPGVTREWVAARLMGRWRDGTPMSLSQDPTTPAPNATNSNDFDYAPGHAQSSSWDDADGARCPIGAHIRRMNPRSSRVAGMPHTRRLIRRGMPYGPAYDPQQPDEAERGLVGVFFCTDLERQFEFLLHTWANADAFASGLTGTQDPIIGAQAATGVAPMSEQFRCLAPDGSTEMVWQLPRLVQTRGSLYLFMPGLAGLKALADGAPAQAATAAGPA
jgi:deferrochelatase/peroxidase EfeB